MWHQNCIALDTAAPILLHKIAGGQVV